MTDKFEKFLSLISKPNSYSDEKRNIVKLMQGLPNSESFLYFYDILPADKKPILDREKNEYFYNTFFGYIKNLDDESFNKYFFELFTDYHDIEELRIQSLKRPDNNRFQIFLKDRDNPKSIDKIVEIISRYYGSDNSRCEELVERYRDRLLKLNQIKSQGSYALENLYWLLNHIVKTESMEKMLHFCQDIKFDIYKCSAKNKNVLKLFNDEFVTQKNVQDLDYLFNLYPEVSKYKVLTSVTDFKNIITILSSDSLEDHHMYFWKIFEPRIHEKLNITYSNPVDTLNAFLEHPAVQKDMFIFNTIQRKDSLLTNFSRMILEEELAKDKISSPKFKL